MSISRVIHVVLVCLLVSSWPALAAARTPCENGLEELARADAKGRFALKWQASGSGSGGAAILVREPSGSSQPLEAFERKNFLRMVAGIDRLQLKGTCPLEAFDAVFVYPKISYAISAKQLAAIRKMKVRDASWESQVMMRLTVARL